MKKQLFLYSSLILTSQAMNISELENANTASSQSDNTKIPQSWLKELKTIHARIYYFMDKYQLNEGELAAFTQLAPGIDQRYKTIFYPVDTINFLSEMEEDKDLKLYLMNNLKFLPDRYTENDELINKIIMQYNGKPFIMEYTPHFNTQDRHVLKRLNSVGRH